MVERDFIEGQRSSHNSNPRKKSWNSLATARQSTGAMLDSTMPSSWSTVPLQLVAIIKNHSNLGDGIF